MEKVSGHITINTKFMINLFGYEFLLRAVIAGTAVALVAPLIGIFLVAKRYSLIADTLSHSALLGAVIGIMTGVSLPVTAAVTVLAALGIERVRTTKRFSGENVLALFLFGSLAIASIIIAKSRGIGSMLPGLLFGSIATVGKTELLVIGITAVLIILAMIIFYKKMFAVCFDEESAKAAGMKTERINALFIIAAALMISLSIRVVGALLIGALMTIPVLAAFLFKKSFLRTTIIAILISFAATLSGIAFSYAFGLPSGGAIIAVCLLIFGIAWITNRK